MKKNNSFFTNDLSKEVYEQSHKFYGNDKVRADIDINDTQHRVSKNLASVELDQDYWTERFLEVMEYFAFMPGGRILSNAGTGLKNTTYINCFVDGFLGKNQDSLESIMDTLKRQGLILASEGGYGFNSDVMRPRGAYINGSGNTSPGSVDMLDMWDMQSAVITKGSGKKNTKGKMKIRKGAQMVTKSLWHPDIEEFITSKQTPNRLTKFNMSVLADNEFMNAVKNHLSWDLKFPDYESMPNEYHDEWDGNIYLWENKGYAVKIYKTYKDANELWDLVMKSTFTRNEPGVLFVSIINKLNNLWYYEYINATNPCGEQLLPIGAVCLLGTLNLTQFINEDGTFNWEKFKSYIPVAVRMLDNVNDLTNVPLEIEKWNLINKRRIGLGLMGYGSALVMMKLRYGSKQALEFTEELMKCLANTAYEASAMLAKEKGAFPLFDADKYLESNFIKNAISPKVQALIRKYGIRNSHLLSFQPNGNTGCEANIVTGGGEPIFLFDYYRTSMQPFAPTGLYVPQMIDWINKTYDSGHAPKIWNWKKEGDENLLWTDFNGSIWKVDKNRGLLKETLIEDYGVRWLREKGEWDEKADWAVNTYNLNVDDHINTMEVIAKYLDSAMSKTINLPENYSYDDFKKIYTRCWETGVIKGCTTYREGTMTAVLSATQTKAELESKFEYHDAPKRPHALPSELHHITALGKKWIVVVGLYEDKPYEVFAFSPDSYKIPDKEKTGKLVRVKSGQYNLITESGYEFDNITTYISDEEDSLTRIISAALRHGTNMDFIVHQLDKSKGTVVSFSKAIARVLRKYAKKLEEQENKVEKMCETGDCKIVHDNGCVKCLTCGYSACK